MNRVKIFAAFVLLISLSGCQSVGSTAALQRQTVDSAIFGSRGEIRKLPADAPEGLKRLIESAHEQTRVTKTYDPAYVVLSYPNGDIPMEKGVCTDVVVRALRKAGVDLQKEVHEDMSANFEVYPQKWGLKKADPNIDHRRVLNLNTFFTRKGKSLSITNKADDYKPGDIVSWDLDGKGLTHTGLVSNIWSNASKRYLIIHNIGSGAKAEDVLFDWKITGHFRYF
jgi:uncharacterized protein YijF (DUF1287 family)